MGSKSDGFPCDHINSDCCNEPVRFKEVSNGYSMTAWCSKCGNYKFTGRVETLIALWLGNLDAVNKNKGYIPEWIRKIGKVKNL